MGAFPNMPNMPMGMTAPPSQQATRHARRVYVGGLPPTATEASISIFFSSALAAIGGNAAGPGACACVGVTGCEQSIQFGVEWCQLGGMPQA